MCCTYEYEKLNPDVYAPLGTDSGSVPNAQWPLGLSHNRFGVGKESGWARQQNTEQLPATQIWLGWTCVSRPTHTVNYAGTRKMNGP
jgi:hypothetical protein